MRRSMMVLGLLAASAGLPADGFADATRRAPGPRGPLPQSRLGPPPPPKLKPADEERLAKADAKRRRKAEAFAEQERRTHEARRRAGGEG